MKTFKESAMRVRQGDVKPTAKIMANQHIEKGNMKKTLDLLKHIGKKVKVDKSTEKTSKAIWTIEGTMNEMKLPISDEMFKSLKKGDKIKIGFDSSIKKGNQNTYVVMSKSKSAKHNLEKIKLKNVANPVAQASFLYNRQGKVTMAQGDMAVTMNTAVKESVELNKNDEITSESTAAYGKSVSDIRNKRNKAAMKPKDLKTLKKLSDLMKNANEDLDKKSVELEEAIDFFKVSKELLDYAKKNGGPDKREFEKAAAYVREIGKNSAVSVQDKAGKGLNDLFKNADTDVRDRMQMILKKGGFKVKGGYVMREGKWFVRQSAKPNKTGTYQGKKYDDGKKAIAQARKDWKLTSDEHMSAKMMKEAIEEGLDARQIALLKKNYSTIDRIDPSGPAYKKAKGMISGLDKDMQMTLAKAKIRILSQIAADELRKQHGVKLKAKDYMESVTTKSFSELRNR